MSQATQPVSNKIAIAFDFDDTLVPDTYDSLIEAIGYDAKTFRKERYYPLLEAGWDGIPARFHTIIEASKDRPAGDKITRSFLQSFGQQITPFPGVSEMFDRLRQVASAIDESIEIEFYIISSGFIELARSSRIAKHFRAMWGCEFHYDSSGEVVCLKRTVTHPEKTRYLYYISRGIDAYSEDNLSFIYEDVSPDELYLPLTQIIYAGDGTSDLPCFALLNQAGGTVIGVYKEGTPHDWAEEYKVSQSQRVHNLVPADYTEHSQMMQSLTLAVESLCKQIQLRQLSLKSS
ncbi:MAG: haloacid dehalogenase-like hydrolase [Cyanobacteria bacterium P01_G01_bin.38]